MNDQQYVMRDPTSEASPVLRQRLKPSGELGQRTVALLSISKERSWEFLDTIEKCFKDRGVNVMRIEKPTHTKPAPETTIQEIVERADLVVEALAD